MKHASVLLIISPAASLEMVEGEIGISSVSLLNEEPN